MGKFEILFFQTWTEALYMRAEKKDQWSNIHLLVKDND